MRKNQKIKVNYNFQNTEIIPVATSLDDWRSNDPLKKRIRFHHSVVQNDACAYCREKIKFGGYGEPIEHIFPKSLALNWMFEPLNLCLSCYGCNTKKGDKPTLLLPYFPEYTRTGTEFLIIHPHFDKFSEHIDSRHIIFKPKNRSDKGFNTIDICKLNRMDLLFTRAKRSKKSKNILIDQNISFLCSSTANQEERKLAGDFIADLIKRAKHKEKINKYLSDL